jgi:hypothetical protein
MEKVLRVSTLIGVSRVIKVNGTRVRGCESVGV